MRFAAWDVASDGAVLNPVRLGPMPAAKPAPQAEPPKPAGLPAPLAEAPKPAIKPVPKPAAARTAEVTAAIRPVDPPKRPATPPVAASPVAAPPVSASPGAAPPPRRRRIDVGAIINRALTAAGLIK